SYLFDRLRHPIQRYVPSFPTRRSSDLQRAVCDRTDGRRQRERERFARGRVKEHPPGHDEISIQINHDATVQIPLEMQVWMNAIRSEEHTSELQSRFDLVCRLLLEKKKY